MDTKYYIDIQNYTEYIHITNKNKQYIAKHICIIQYIAVATRRVAWIKMDARRYFADTSNVATHRVAWIEISQGLKRWKKITYCNS